MVDGDLGHPEAGLRDLGHHLDADDAAVLGQLDLVEDVATDQPQVAVDVADRQAEHRAHDGVVQLADDDPLERVVALDLVPLDDVDVVAQALGEQPELARVVLGVAVGVADQRPSRRARSRSVSAPP